MRRNTSTSAPLDSPARTMLTYKSEKMRGCLAIESDKLRPSITSCFSSLLTSAEMPLDSRCVMLLSATVSGIPELSRLANCCVKVASSWSLGLRFWDIAARKVGGNRARQSALRPGWPFGGGRDRAPLAASTATGKSPRRSI